MTYNRRSSLMHAACETLHGKARQVQWRITGTSSNASIPSVSIVDRNSL
jgi:hypothetical protein